MNYEKTGLLIASLRKEKGLTQKELADKLGITDRAVSKWERGLGCPDISLLDDLSRILDISILEILRGRRLDKDEIVNNESLIESMNYSKENLKHKLKKYFNWVSIFIIVIIFLKLINYNLSSIYYLSKTYHNDYFNNQEGDLSSEIDNNIEKIKSNKGIYKDEDYKKILTFITKLENNLKEQNNTYYYEKKNYTYSDLIAFYKSHQNYIYFERLSVSPVDEILHKYDASVINNVVSYYASSRALIDYIYNLSEALKAPYYNNKKIDKEVTVYVDGFIYSENYRDNKLLEDIIKVGEIDE